MILTAIPAEKKETTFFLLLHAAEMGDLTTGTRLLTTTENQSVDLNCQDDTGATPLSRAARMGRIEVVRYLLPWPEVSVNCADDFGWTPLSWSAWYGDHDVVQQLLAYLDIAADRADENGTTPLMFASRKGHAETVRCLLDSKRVGINLRHNDDRTALSQAAENDRACDAVTLLMGYPFVVVDAKDHSGRSPLSWAAQGGAATNVRTLLQRSNVDPDSMDCEHRSPLYWAAERAVVEVVGLLLNGNRVNPEAATVFVDTPVTLAEILGQSHILDLFRGKVRQR